MSGVFRRIWLGWLFVRYAVQRRWRGAGVSLECVAGRQVVVLPSVFNPAMFFTSTFLVRQLDRGLVRDGASVLDLGTGSGIVAVAVGPRARRVVAVDINPAAVRCATANVFVHGIEDRVIVHHGDLFEAVGDERFDHVVFNPPYLSGEPVDAADQAFRGADVARRFAQHVSSHLKPTGDALVVLSTAGRLEVFLEAAARHALTTEVVAEQNLFSEVLRLYRFVPSEAVGTADRRAGGAEP